MIYIRIFFPWHHVIIEDVGVSHYRRSLIHLGSIGTQLRRSSKHLKTPAFGKLDTVSHPGKHGKPGTFFPKMIRSSSRGVKIGTSPQLKKWTQMAAGQCKGWTVDAVDQFFARQNSVYIHRARKGGRLLPSYSCCPWKSHPSSMSTWEPENKTSFKSAFLRKQFYFFTREAG